MLVAAGNRAQFWGTGTLNGSAARFRITTVDGGEGHDAIRIELVHWPSCRELHRVTNPDAECAPSH